MSDTDEPSAKRLRSKGATACDACRRRRSRCDLVDNVGCHRCKQLRTECSLKGYSGYTAVAGDVGRSHSQDGLDLDQILTRMAQMEKELTILRSAPTPAPPTHARTPLNNPPFDYNLPSLEARASSSRPPSILESTSQQPQHSPVAETVHERDETWYRRWADPETFSLIHRGIKSMTERGLRDPIAEGIISEAQAETAYQLFKYHFSTLHPHPKLLVVRSPLPRHPFLLSACLSYIARIDSRLNLLSTSQLEHLEAYLHANLNAYHHGCRSSLEGIMAAFILSHMPPGPKSLSTALSTFDGARMIGLAYAQVRELGQSVTIQRLINLLEAGVPIEHLDGQLDDARLFMSVVNRSAWYAHSRCPWATTPVLVEPSHSKLLSLLQSRGIETPIDHHLMVEHEILSVLNHHSKSWQASQASVVASLSDIVAGNDMVLSTWMSLDGVLARLKSNKDVTSGPYLAAYITYCKWWITVRNVWSMYRLPSPLWCGDVYGAWLSAVGAASRGAGEMLSTCLADNWSLERLPYMFGDAVLLCYAALSMGQVHFQHFHPGVIAPEALDVAESLDQIESKIQASESELSNMLVRTKEKLVEYRLQLDLSKIAPNDQATAIPVDGYAGGVDLNDLLLTADGWWNWLNTGSNEPEWDFR